MGFGVTRDPLSGAISRNQAATGRPVYGLGGGTSPTRGQTLDKAGYEERDMRKRARRREETRRFAQMAGGSSPLGGAAFGGAGGLYGGR